MSKEQDNRLPEIALVGDLTEHESELTDRLLDIAPGGERLIYFVSPGGDQFAREDICYSVEACCWRLSSAILIPSP